MIPLLLTAAFLIALWAQQRAFGGERREWTKERQLLITRIQHPEFVVAAPEEIKVPDADLLTSEPDDIDMVGTIQMNGSNGSD